KSRSPKADHRTTSRLHRPRRRKNDGSTETTKQKLKDRTDAKSAEKPALSQKHRVNKISGSGGTLFKFLTRFLTKAFVRRNLVPQALASLRLCVESRRLKPPSHCGNAKPQRRQVAKKTTRLQTINSNRVADRTTAEQNLCV